MLLKRLTPSILKSSSPVCKTLASFLFVPAKARRKMTGQMKTEYTILLSTYRTKRSGSHRMSGHWCLKGEGAVRGCLRWVGKVCKYDSNLQFHDGSVEWITFPGPVKIHSCFNFNVVQLTSTADDFVPRTWCRARYLPRIVQSIYFPSLMLMPGVWLEKTQVPSEPKTSKQTSTSAWSMKL